jgi:drug/metabolite transporter (DMT)-like permease
MSYIAIAVIAYFLVALEVILDKFLLTSKRVSHPAIYAFYSGLLTSFVFFMVPFSFHQMSLYYALLSLLTGMIFTYGILSLFFAINKSEASRVMPVVGAVIPIMTFVLSVAFLAERLRNVQLVGVLALILGGLLISFDFPLKNKKKFFLGFELSIVAGILLGIEVTLFKYLSDYYTFANVFIWTRWGVTLGALSLLIIPSWRKVIMNSFGSFRHSKKEHHQTGGLFILNKILGGAGSILTKKAITLGSATIVSALVSTEYVFILLIGLIMSFQLPKIFQEKETFLDITQKVVSILIISLGVFLISKNADFNLFYFIGHIYNQLINQI